MSCYEIICTTIRYKHFEYSILSWILSSWEDYKLSSSSQCLKPLPRMCWWSFFSNTSKHIAEIYIIIFIGIIFIFIPLTNFASTVYYFKRNFSISGRPMVLPILNRFMTAVPHCKGRFSTFHLISCTGCLKAHWVKQSGSSRRKDSK